MSIATRVGATTNVVDHGHTKRGDGGLLNFAKLLAGQAPLILPVVKRTGETAAITTTSLVVAPAPGVWGVLGYLEDTTHTTNGTITVTIGWTDDVGATTDATFATAFTGTGRGKAFIVPLEIASGNLTYAVALGTWAGEYTIRLVPVRFV